MNDKPANPSRSPKLSTRQWSRKKLCLFSLVTVFLFAIALEFLSFLFFLSKGEITGDLAWHPLFRNVTYKNAIWGASRFMYDPFLGYRFKPNTPYFSFGTLSINEHGFIDNGNAFPDLQHKPEDVTRVFVLGGSSVAGCGASANRTTIPACMEKLLNEKNAGPYEVINAGVDGYSTYQELTYFSSDIVNDHPDIVVFFDGWNDYANPCWVGGYVDEYQKQHARINHHEYGLYLLTIMPQLQRKRPTISIDANLLLNRTYSTLLMKRIYARITRRALFQDVESSLDVRNLPDKLLLEPEQAAQMYVQNVRTSVGAVTAHGCKVLYALQPTPLDKPFLADGEGEIFHTGILTDHAEKVRRYYDSVRPQFKRLADALPGKNACIVDLSSTLWKEIADKVYLDEIHTNDHGNRIIAQRLVDTLLTWLQGEKLPAQDKSKPHLCAKFLTAAGINNNSDLKALLRKARDLLDAGNTDRVVTLLKPLVDTCPDFSGEACYLLAFALHHANNPDAFHYYAAALDLGFSEFWVRYNRGQLYLSLRKRKQALEDLSTALRLNPNHKDLAKLIGTLQPTAGPN